MGDDLRHDNEPDLRRLCQRTIRDLIERYDWALLTEVELLDRVLDSIESNVTSAEVERRVKNQYTLALYHACRQADDLNRRERAYLELFHILCRVAHRRWPELADDATQRALILVYEQIDRCRDPGAFLAFALAKLRHAFQQVQRAQGNELPLEATSQTQSQENPPALLSDLLHQELQQALLDAIERLSDERQQDTIRLKYFDGLSDEAIGARLGITANHVRVLRHRAMAHLRKDEGLRDFLE